jgi:hypothetical protein
MEYIMDSTQDEFDECVDMGVPPEDHIYAIALQLDDLLPTNI